MGVLWLINGGYEPHTKWDDPPSRVGTCAGNRTEPLPWYFPRHRISRIRKWPMNASVGNPDSDGQTWVKSWAVNILGRDFFGVSPLPPKMVTFKWWIVLLTLWKKDETRIWGVKLQVTKSPPTWEGENYKHHLPKSHQTCLVPLKPPFKTALYRVAFNKNWVFFL